MRRFKKSAIVIIGLIGISLSFAYKSDFFEIAKQLEIYTSIFKELNMYYIDDINPAKLNEVAIKAMLKSLDPYTYFYDEQSIENARINAGGQFGGIGIVAKFINDKLIVTDVFKASPAAKNNIAIGDEISSINNVSVDVNQKQSALAQLKGMPGASIGLTLNRQNNSIKKTLNFIAISQNTVPYYSLLDKKTGYIALTEFNEQAFDSVESAFLNLKEKGMTNLILDLRNNPGGLLNQAIDIVSLFVPKGSLVVTTKAKVKAWSETYRTMKDPLDTNMPLVILVNRHSASASEIVSGALQDLDRAVIIGTRSYGKGLVQRYRKLPYGTQFKLTISKYYTPSGRNIQELDYTNRVGDSIPKFSDQKRPKYKTKNGRTIYGGGGITPDVVVPLPEMSNTTEALLKSDAVFNFATQYVYNHKAIEPIEKFSLTQNDLQTFINQMNTDKTFESPVQQSFEASLQKAQNANLNLDKISQKLNDLILQEQTNQLQQNKSVLIKALSSEIIKRYYYDEGMYQYKIQHDNTIKKALEIISDSKQYQSIFEVVER